jgi:hypothetical protein
VSDTVVGVSNGRGSIYGSGTNAPLYASMFLNRSDPEAELEAYERRLALAFEINQADRVLDHTSPPPKSPLLGSPGSTNSSSSSPGPPLWRDNAWIKDGVTTRLSLNIYFLDNALTLPFKRLV